MVRCLFDIFLNPVLLQRIKKQVKTALMKYLAARGNEPNSSLPLDYLSLQQFLVNNKLNYQYKFLLYWNRWPPSCPYKPPSTEDVPVHHRLE